MKKLKLLTVATVLLLVAITPLAQAAEFIAPGKADDGVITLSSNQGARNLYIAGATLNLGQETSGDLVAAGATVNVENKVEADAILAGGTVYVRGSIGDDLRAAAGTLVVRGSIGGDALLLAGTISIDPEAQINGDLVAAGGSVHAKSNVNGKANIAGGTVILSGTVTGPVHVRAEKLIVESGAKISQLVYHGPGQPEVKNGAEVGSIEVKQTGAHSKKTAGNKVGGWLFQLASLFIAGLVVAWLLQGRLQVFGHKFGHAFWKDLGIGLLGLVVPPLLFVLSLIIFGLGYLVGFIIMLLYIAIMLLAIIFGTVAIGAWTWAKIMRKESMKLDWQAALLGSVIISLVCLVPFIGPLAVFIVFLVSFGLLIRQVIAGEKTFNKTE